MDRLEPRRGKPTRRQVAESYSWFTEGPETVDLKQARTLLNTTARAGEAAVAMPQCLQITPQLNVPFWLIR
jgi:hypothetical protein